MGRKMASANPQMRIESPLAHVEYGQRGELRWRQVTSPQPIRIPHHLFHLLKSDFRERLAPRKALRMDRLGKWRNARHAAEKVSVAKQYDRLLVAEFSGPRKGAHDVFGEPIAVGPGANLVDHLMPPSERISPA